MIKDLSIWLAIHVVSALRNYNASVSGRLNFTIREVYLTIETKNLHNCEKKSPDNETAKRPSKSATGSINKIHNFSNYKPKKTIKDTIFR